MSRIEADHCEKKLAGRRQEIPKKIDKWNYALCIYDALNHMLRMSSPENAFSSLC